MKANKCLRDVTAPANREDPQAALRDALQPLDLSQPMWLPRHLQDWEEYGFTRFLPEHFLEFVPFDRMEVSYIAPEGEPKPVRQKRSILEDV